MKITRSLRLFFFVSLGLAALNVFVLNGGTTLWGGAEVRFVRAVLFGGDPAGYLPYLAVGAPSSGGLREGLLRLPGALLLVAVVALVFPLARPLFGRVAAAGMVLIMGASFLVPALGKAATADVWAFAFQLLSVLLLLRWLKQPRALWRWLFYGVLLGAGWVQPLGTLLLMVVFAALLYRWHPEGRRLRRLNPWLAVLVAGGLPWLTGLAGPAGGAAYLSFRPAAFTLANLAGMLPFAGFLVAGLADTWRKGRRGEELARINAAWLLAALAGQSLSLQAVLGLLAAKQMMAYFDPAYPHRNAVRAGAVLHLLLVFFLAMGFLLGSFARLEGAGFRAALGPAAVYWMGSFAVVVGLFGMNRRLVWGGGVLSVLLATLLFWLQMGQLLETRRDLPRRLTEAVLSRLPQGRGEAVVYTGGGALADAERLYLQAAGLGVREMAAPDDLRAPRRPATVYVLPAAVADSLRITTDAIRLPGWDARLTPMEWCVVW